MIGVWAAAAAVPPDHTVFYVGLLSVLGTLVSAYAVYRASAAATRNTEKSSQSEQQLKWTQQAMAEASSAKADAEEARLSAQSAEAAARIAIRQSGEATERAIAAEERLSNVESLARSLLLWIEQIMSAAQDKTVSDSEVRGLITGGPADLRTARDRLRRSHSRDSE